MDKNASNNNEAGLLTNSEQAFDIRRIRVAVNRVK
jgi:hypothetical protein